MVTETVKTISEELQATGYALPKDCKNAINTLNTLYLQLDNTTNADDQQLLTTTLNYVKLYLPPEKIQVIWDFQQTAEFQNDLKASLNSARGITLQQHMLRDIAFIHSLTYPQLIAGAQHSFFDTVIAMIRKGLLEDNLDDPFVDANKNQLSHTPVYAKGAAANTFKACGSIPTEQLVLLAGKDMSAKRQMLNMLSGTVHYFTLSAAFADDENMREEIASTWQQLFESNQFDFNTRAVAQELHEELGQKYAEFREVDLAHCRRTHEQPQRKSTGENSFTAPRIVHFIRGIQCSSKVSTMEGKMSTITFSFSHDKSATNSAAATPVHDLSQENKSKSRTRISAA